VELRRASTGKSQALQRRLHALVLERQRLRDEHVSVGALERNRIEIVQAQLELSRALVSERGITPVA
jgi:hypothetical protein